MNYPVKMCLDGFNVIILAAGKGTRMKSSLPKVLHKIIGRSMLDMVCDTVLSFSAINVVVVSSDEILSFIDKNNRINYVVQKERLGTGHAVLTAISKLDDNFEKTIILCGDTPLIDSSTIELCLDDINKETDMIVGAFVSSDINNAYYGRLLTDKDRVLKIVEYKNASQDIRNIKICNSSVYAIKTNVLKQFIDKIQKNDIAQEYYLTDLVEILSNNGFICKYSILNEDILIGINSYYELAFARKRYNMKLSEFHMSNGICIADPDVTYFYDDTVIGSGTFVGQGVIIEKNVKIGSNCRIGAYSIISNSIIGDNCRIESFSHIDGCIANDNISIGPLARIRPNTILESGSRIGNFVEIKNSEIGNLSKANHLAYIGDSIIGSKTNFGAGSIICNYDGFQKHKTSIGDNSLIGANCSIIAPVVIGENVVIGAGSVITKNIENNDLAISRTDQKNIKNGAILYKNKKKN